jgi:acyl-CoA synthetase (AMP-forming)/AMP-acid ligase II
VEGRVTTADALHDRTLGLAAWLLERGVVPGDRVLLLVPAGPDFAAALLAIAWIGAAAVLLEPDQAPGAFAARVRAARPSVALVDPRLVWAWRLPLVPQLLRARGVPIPARPDLRVLALPAATRGAAPCAPRADGDEALVLLTSGTTAAPKVVVHTHGTLAAFLGNVARLVEGLDVGSYLAETPQQLFYALLLDATCHVVRGQGEARLGRTLAVLSSGEVRAWFGGPWTWVRWLERGLPVPPTLRTVLLGSAPVTRPFLRRLLAVLPPDADVRCVYGLTETGPVCVADGREKAAREVEGDWVGRPLQGIEVRVRDEIEVRSASCPASLAPGGWLPTGDLGRLGAEGVVLLGRSKDMIVRRGINLYPGVLEPLLLERVPDAVLVGVFDAEAQDERVVLVHTGATPAGLDDLLGDAAPDHVLGVPELPRTGRQHKVDKEALRRLARVRFLVP